MSAYVGRFAPTPSGPLHFGSIIAALGSFLDARANDGRWLLRIDDIDAPRVRSGARDSILGTLEKLGLHWDGTIISQQDRFEDYRRICNHLTEQGCLYRCYCSRKTVRGGRYPGTCRDRQTGNGHQFALRVITRHSPLLCSDAVQGERHIDPAAETGDFIVWRADGIPAYHLATVIDDAFQQVTHVVRGADLLPSCGSQMYLQQLLGYPHPRYVHLPVAVDDHGRKISKSSHAPELLPETNPSITLFKALVFLGQDPDSDLISADSGTLLQWAIGNWQTARVPARCQIGIHYRG